VRSEDEERLYSDDRSQARTPPRSEVWIAAASHL
jgi:hypothetical protein